MRVTANVMLAATALAGVLSSCSTLDCTSDARLGLVVTVVEADGTPICDADVSFVLPDAVEKPVAYESVDGSCTYGGAMERSGTNSIRVASRGRTQRIDDVEVSRGQCHVHLRRVLATFDSPPVTT